MDKKHCLGCYDNFYNGNNSLNIKTCMHLKTAKLVKRIRIGHWENPPYLGKKIVKVPNCYTGGGPDRIHYIDPKWIDSRGYWKR